MTAHACNECGAEPYEEHKRACRYHPIRAEVDRALGDGSHADAKRLYAHEPADVSGMAPGVEIPDYVSAEDVFMSDVFAEVRKARAKFPGNGSLVTGLALGEESGEAQRALLHIYEGKSAEQPLYEECVQTAAMALRLALESADRTEWLGNVRKRVRDELADPVRFPRRAD